MLPFRVGDVFMVGERCRGGKVALRNRACIGIEHVDSPVLACIPMQAGCRARRGSCSNLLDNPPASLS